MKHTSERTQRRKQERIRELFLVGCEQAARQKKREGQIRRERLEKLLLERLEARRARL